MSLKVSIPPIASVLAVTLADVKANSVVDHTDDDNSFSTIWIPGAVDFVERHTGQCLVQRTFEYKFDVWPADGVISLPAFPVLGVDSITFTNQNASPMVQTVSAALYELDEGVRPNQIFLKFGQLWPVATAQRNSITVTFRAGYISTNVSPLTAVNRTLLPPTFKSAILLQADDFYRFRASKESIALHENNALASMLAQQRWYQ
jgi:uncharacterized phiE125 gp8 family phage protein